MKQLKERIPYYAILPLIVAFSLNMLIYAGCRLVNAGRTHYILKTPLDDHIPFLTVFILVYVGAFAQWAISYVLVAFTGKDLLYRIVLGDIIAKLMTCVIFLIIPTMIVRPEITGNGFLEALTRFIYKVDAPDNLFPSIHCLESWVAFRAALMMKKLPRWYAPVSLIFTLLVFFSTVTLRQHYLPDIPGGVVMAEAGLFISGLILKKPKKTHGH